jgi:2-methylcitrate dehydratase PrpD
MLAKKGVKAGQVASLECVVPEIERALICEPFQEKLRPATPYAAKFSLPFLLASKMADGDISHRTFAADNLRREELLQLAARVRYRISSPGEMPFPKTFPGWVEATLNDGRRMVERLDVNAGHPDNPLSFEQVAEKFRDNSLESLGEHRVEQLINLVSALPEASVGDIASALSTAPHSLSQLNRRKIS